MLLRLACLLLFVMLNTMATQSYAKQDNPIFYRNFWRPTYHADRLDYCKLGGKDCGHPVAEQYCKMLGFDSADKEIIENNVGLTRYIGCPGTCKGWRCNGFKLIRCIGTIKHQPPETYYYRYRRFVFPRYEHYRVDWCYENGQGCGKKAATSYCKRLGYLQAKSYQTQSHVPATKEIGDQKLCFGNNCKAFKEIVCYR